MRDLIKKKLIEVNNHFKTLKEIKRTSGALMDQHDLILIESNRDRIIVLELMFLLDLDEEKYIDLVPGICDELGLNYFGVITSQELIDDIVDYRKFVIELV